MHGGRGRQWANQMQVLWNGNQGTDRHFWKGQPKATCIWWTLLSAGASSEKSRINVLWFIKANTAPSTVTWWSNESLLHLWHDNTPITILFHASFSTTAAFFLQISYYTLMVLETWKDMVSCTTVMQGGVKMHFCRIHALLSKINDLLFLFLLIIMPFVFLLCSSVASIIAYF